MKILNVQKPGGKRIDAICKGEDVIIDGSKLLCLPALIDPHVHFRTPGWEYKEDWKSGAKAAIKGGITTVIDMPNHIPPCTSLVAMKNKRKGIDAQLAQVRIPLRYQLYLGLEKGKTKEMRQADTPIKIFMGSSTGDMLFNDEDLLDEAFRIAAEKDLLIAVHAEDEQTIRQNRENYSKNLSPISHSEIRTPAAAEKAVDLAISLAKKHGTRLYLLHISCEEELQLIRKAKREKVSLFAEATPHHLFLNEEIYQDLGCKAQVNPPLRKKKDVDALWKAVDEGIIDTIGSDHAPHLISEKEKPFPEAPSGMPGVETTLPLLLNAHHEGKISLEKIMELTHYNPQKLFRLESNNDLVLIDLEHRKTVEEKDLKTKAKWSAYAGLNLQGWPMYTVLKNQIYDLKNI